MDTANGDLLPGEWEGEIREEVVVNGIVKYLIAWVPTLEPKENVSPEMMEEWEAKKAAAGLAPRGDSNRGSGTKKQRAGTRARAKVEKIGSKGGRRGRARTRPRKG